MSGNGQDSSQWLSVTEETLFMHDGLIRVTDLVELPRDVNSGQTDSEPAEVITFDTHSPAELSQRLLTVCGNHNNSYARLLEYRLNALRGLWNAQHEVAIEEHKERECTSHEETVSLLKKQGLWKEPEQASFATKISLILVLPLLQSQSRIDPNLGGLTAELLLNCLKGCAPLSLGKEPSDCLNGLEDLLSSWLGEKDDPESDDIRVSHQIVETASPNPVVNEQQKTTTASALVALACARGHLKTFVHTIHLLQKFGDSLGALQIGDVLRKLLQMEGGQSQPTAVLGGKHILCWGLDDTLTRTEKNAAVASSSDREKGSTDCEMGRTVACDGTFLYMSNTSGRGIVKMGTGLHGTLRGYVYARNCDIETGFLAWGSGFLLHRPVNFDKETKSSAMVNVLNQHSLQSEGTLIKPSEYHHEGSITTVCMCGDGMFLYWVWCHGVLGEKNARLQPVYLDTFRIDIESKAVVPVHNSVLVQKKEENSGKTINETLLSRLRPYKSAPTTATLVALTGGDVPPSRKEEATTTCGVSLKILLRTPIFCDGTTLVMLTSVPGGNNSGPARSLFGSGTSLASLRSLANNLCFNVEDGQFNTRSELVDAPTCSIARGAPVLGLGVTYDAVNNMIWMASTDWMDQFYNPGHQASHHTLKKLGLDPLHITLPIKDIERPVQISQVMRILLQHVGSTCVHQLSSDLLHTPLGNFLLQQHPPDLVYLRRVCDVLEAGMEQGDRHVMICCVVILHLLFKTSVFKREVPAELKLIEKTSRLVWSLLDNFCVDDIDNQPSQGVKVEIEAIQNQVCNLISGSLGILYPKIADQYKLLHKLLTDGKKSQGLNHLRDLILMEFAEQLRNTVIASPEVYSLRLTDDLVHYILKIAVQESCVLLRQCQKINKEKLEEILASVPMSSPCLQYLMALQCHILRIAVLHQQSQEVDICGYHHENLQDLQSSVLSLASNIFTGAHEVLEVLLETCNSVIHSEVDDREMWLGSLERVARASLLGHLLPALLTAMNHHSLRCLSIADTLMPQLVQLVILTSQAALLLKSQVQVIRENDLVHDGPEMDIYQLIGEAICAERLEKEQQEEQGFLSGLKIPAPWTTGKTVETIHPVRDNYKFKETVHIPGARCLYLRFDARCSSQYDYDKLVVHAGPNTGARKVAEYGGNTFGYGSRSVLGSGWPKDLVKVEGDTVTFSFEMRSGREHNTPDKAMWGLMVTVRAQESTEEVSGGLPFLADLALSLSVLACTMLHLLYQGPDRTPDEEACQHLLKSRLLQRCVWQTGGMLEGDTLRPLDLPIQEDRELKFPSTPSLVSPRFGPTLPRIRLPAEIVAKLRDLAPRQTIQIRPSVREILQLETVQESLLSAVIKHLALTDTVYNLTGHAQQQSPEFFMLKDVVIEAYRRLDSITRQLMSLAELETRWHTEVDDIRQGLLQPEHVFFIDYHLAENKSKELAILCFLKDVQMDPNKLEKAVVEMRDKMEEELAMDNKKDSSPLEKTSSVVKGLLERTDLLLRVTIAPEAGMSFTRSMSHLPEINRQVPSVMVRSDTDVLKATPSYSHSLSAPSELDGVQDDSILEIIRLQRKRQAQKGLGSILHDLVESENERDKPPHVILIDQLISFIGSNPQKAVSIEQFLSAARVRCKRGTTRQRALVHMKELLTAATRVGGATHLVAAVTSVLQHGPRVDELTCGGIAEQVREAFAETMTSVVQLAARFPIACCNSIGLLCIIPYTRAEEKCLVRSGLVHLLDKLCSLTSYRTESNNNTEAQNTRQRVASMAWAGFQVLSNRCVTWEQEDGAYAEELEHSGLARQVSTLLTNHLARATECSGNEAAGNEALQEVLSLLNDLSRSRMGKAILSQPGCVSKLLSLLLDQRPSPKLVLIILQLCRVALPLMSAGDCDKVELPAWGQEFHSTLPAQHSNENDMDDAPLYPKPLKIASLLVAKLGDFLVPGGQTTVSSRRPSREALNGMGNFSGNGSGEKDKDEMAVQDGRMSVFVHKREDQSSHEVMQRLLTCDSRPFRMGGGANMDKVVRMDKEMSKAGFAEVTTEDAVSALRRAAKWAQMGLVVSTGPSIDSSTSSSNGGDKKKMVAEVVCKEKNNDLARTDPVRPFISGHVANSMAAEVIALLHSLLTASETLAAQTWVSAVEKVISSALSCLPMLLTSVEEVTSPRCNKEHLMTMAKQANAAWAALGGFEETIKPGCSVMITGEDMQNCQGIVESVSEQTGLAVISLQPSTSQDFEPPRYSDTVQVPLSRLIPPRNQPLPLHKLSMTESIVTAIQALLLPQNTFSAQLAQPLPLHGPDASNLPNQICRVVGEMRTRACKVLAHHLKDLGFASSFIQHCSAAIGILKSLAKDCTAGERAEVVETECHRLRMLYWDCAKPPPPPSKVINKPVKEITWDASRAFPPARACLFSHGMTGLTFLADPNAGSGLPRGTLVYATQPIPHQAPSFYWELEICSFGDSQEDSGPVISFGFMPAAEKKDGAWTNPVGTCLFHNNGRAVHYNGSSLLQWRSVRLDAALTNCGDVAGIGWERQGTSPPVPGQPVKGLVYFTHNGRRMSSTIEEVSGSMWPVVHIQKKNTRIKGNFGGKPFAYAEGTSHRNAADDYHDLTQEIRETFGVLPFNLGSDSEGEGPISISSNSSTAGSPHNSPTNQELRLSPGPPCRTPAIPKANREYNTESSSHYKLLRCYENFTVTGPDPRNNQQQGGQDDESDLEDGEDGDGGEDHYALLVKAWEQKVFPTIRRRFRNEAERKDGLEQIRGALQLGMTDIARQTVEFLYEENGGMPRDLNLPTIDDIKDELAKFTIERVRKGTIVVIRMPSSSNNSTGTLVLPKFAVRGMLKTFGLTGVVLDVDQPTELVQVETYLRSEGVLVRYWYPLPMLERPPQGYRKSTTIIGHQGLDTNSILLHRELLRSEALLARMHSRTALLELISQCNSPAALEQCGGAIGGMGIGVIAASAALLQELDVENLQLLSNQLLAGPQLPRGGLPPTCLTNAPSPSRCLAANTASLSDIVYTKPVVLQDELKVAVSRAANQGEDYLIELSDQICMCLQTAPEMFPYEEFPVVETKIYTDVHFPGAGFLVISCKADPKAVKKDTSLYKSPWARIYTYRAHRIKRNGQCARQEVVCYPRDTSSSANSNEQYAPIIVPTELIHIRIGVSPPPGIILTIHAVPPQFSLAVSYIEVLVSQREHFEYRKSNIEMDDSKDMETCRGAEARTTMSGSSLVQSKESSGSLSPWRTFDSVVIPPAVLLHIIELIGGYLWRSDVPAILKEYMFHLLAQSLRVLTLCDSGIGNILPTFSPKVSPSLALLLQLKSELHKLYIEETKNWSSGTTSSGVGIGLGYTDSGRFSTYFHALMEVSMAVAEVTTLSSVTTHVLPGTSGGACDDKPSTSTSAPAIPTSPMSSGKRKKLKAKRERERTSSMGKRSGSPRRLSEGDSPLSTSPSPSASNSSSSCAGGPAPSTSTKQEDMQWFNRAITMSLILRNMVDNDLHGSSLTNDAVCDAAQLLTSSTAHTRLLLISGIPKSFDEEMVRRAITSTCNTNGGLYRDELYLPTEEMVISNVGVVPKKELEHQHASKLSASPETTEPHSQDESPPSADKNKNKSNTSSKVKTVIQGYAVIELRSKTKVEGAKRSLLCSKALLEGGTVDAAELSNVPDEVFSISTINSGLYPVEEAGTADLGNYLLDKLVLNKSTGELTDHAMIAFTDIFHSCFISEQRVNLSESKLESGYICLGREQIMLPAPGNLMQAFLNNLPSPRRTFPEQVSHILLRYGVPKVTDKDDSDKKSKSKKSTKPSKEKLALATTIRTMQKEKKPKAKETPEKTAKDTPLPPKLSKECSKGLDRLLTLEGFLMFVAEQFKHDVRAVWRGLFACGFDLHFERVACYDTSQAQQMSEHWDQDKDASLVTYVNKLCRHLAIAPSRLHPHEIYINESELGNPLYSSLQGIPVESLRLRFAFLQFVNNTLETFFLPLVDLRPSINTTYVRSSGNLMSRARAIMFYDTKSVLVDRIVNATAQRKPDQAAPEITLDPLENVGGERKPPQQTHFCQALRQLLTIPSSQLCVRLAAGGDPTYAFNVRLTGEEVHGTSGSFRQFLWQVARELESAPLDLLILCPSSAAQKNRGKYILRPGPMTFAEEKLLEFLGQVLAVTVRADIPFGLDLLQSFWKNLVGIDLDPVTDLQDADILTYTYLKKLEMADSEEEVEALCVGHTPRFVYTSMNGQESQLLPNGCNIPVTWENRQQYIDCVKNLRMSELRCKHRMCAVRAGMASILPVQLLSLLSPTDADMRTCGLPYVNLDFLKAHTMYQVGLMESDSHVQYFWTVLDSLSQEELCKFIKFACNQERIPQTCPCRDGGPDTAHVPPYPMKIAPPDGPGSPDTRYIRVETCMFMLKLPQYSSLQLMRDMLLYAIHCREDPLTG